MARIRSIKPTIWGDESFIRLSRDARLLMLGLISNADDEGRFIAAPSHVSAAVFPHEEVKPALVRRWLYEIVTENVIVLYEVGDRCYGYFPSWKKHQKVNRPYPSLLPSPPQTDPTPPRGSRNGSVNGSVNDSRPESLTDSMTDSLQRKKGRTDELKKGGTEEGLTTEDGPSTSSNETREAKPEGPSPDTTSINPPTDYAPHHVAWTLDELVAQIHEMRPGWKPVLIRNPIRRMLDKGISLERVALAAYAVASDPTSKFPIRLTEDGWWWDEHDTRRQQSDATITAGVAA